MNNADLLLHKKADDKHYLIGKDVRFLDNNLIELHFKSEDAAIYFEDLKDFQSQDTSDQLLSMGVIVLFGENIENAEIPLLERDILAKADPLRLTMPAGRLDMTLSQGCMAELFEEMIFANDENYFQVDRGVCNFAQMQKLRIQKLELESKPVQIMETLSLKIPNTYTVRMFLDDREIDSVENIFLSKDEANKTLEFRQVLLMKKPENLNQIIDGDGFERNVFLFSLKELVQVHEKCTNENLQKALFESGKSLMPEADIFFGKQKGRKLRSKAQLPVPLITKTLNDFLRSCKA